MTSDEMDKATVGMATKSAKIRTLDRLGATRSEIANYLGIRYQHVRNVLVSPMSSSQNSGVSTNPSSTSVVDEGPSEVLVLSIEEAKRGLAARFGVSPNAIDITIRG